MMPKTTDKQSNSNGRDAQGRFMKGHRNGFQPGQSGNPQGRPKSITLSDAYRRALAQVVDADPQGRTWAELIAQRVCRDALGGNTAAAREIADRVEGRPRQSLDIDMVVTDWRELARRHGLNESDVIREARLLIESATDSSRLESD